MEKQKVYIARVSSRYGSGDQAIFSEKKLAELGCSLKKTNVGRPRNCHGIRSGRCILMGAKDSRGCNLAMSLLSMIDDLEKERKEKKNDKRKTTK